MIKKQFYISENQDFGLKALAKQTNMTEAKYLRQLIDVSIAKNLDALKATAEVCKKCGQIWMSIEGISDSCPRCKGE